MNIKIIQILAEQTGISPADIRRIASNAPRRYKVFEIAKRNGRGTRIIAQPSRELKALQRVVIERILAKLPIHNAVHGFVRNRGIRTNAQLHVENRFILKMDVADFFPSILPRDLEAHLTQYPCENVLPEDFKFLSNLLFWKPKGDNKLKLCIGAPSSPYIANTIFYNLDNKIYEKCIEQNVVYSRYADDMTFSTNTPDVLKKIAIEIPSIFSKASYPKLVINQEKTVNASRAHRRVVTGVVLANSSTLSLGRNKKRQIRTMVHYANNKKLDDLALAKLTGLISFAHDIEPVFAIKMRSLLTI